MTDYVELHLHTAFSFLDGASLPEELVARAAELGYQHLAITDHDGLHGAMEFAQAARAAGIAPITGAELTLTDGSHLTLLAETAQGYSNLSRLITAAHAPDPAGPWPSEPAARTPRLDPALLPEHAQGLILLTGCRVGRLSKLVDADELRSAAVLLRQYVDWFGTQNVYVELQHNLVFGDTPRLTKLTALAERLGLPTVATGNVHYHRPERHRLQDVLVAIRHRTTLDGCHRQRRPNAEFVLRSPQEAARHFAAYPEAVRNTVVLAERCAAFDLTRGLPYQFPTATTREGEDADDALRRICLDAFAARYSGDQRAEAMDRLEEELRLISLHGLASFFLLYRELLELAREVASELRVGAGTRALPPGRGRGSSVGSIVCYLIGLSPVDPLRYNLKLGRFLNEELSTIPDIDLDFPREIRERLMERVYERYGTDHAALICAFPTYRLRSAVRDVGKALGIPVADLDRIAKLSESGSATRLGEELARIPDYAPRLSAPPWSFLVELSAELAGFPRHVSQHSGGMVIAAAPLIDLAPVQPAAMEGRWLVQWDKDSCQDAQFVKIDFLALGMLSLVEECLDLIEANGNEPVDLSRIDFDDPDVYDMICAGDTVGVFQIESRAQIQTLPRTRPRSLDDLTVQVAIVRPGPIEGGAVNLYIQGREALRVDSNWKPPLDHPSLEPVVGETLGAILYQDQVIEAAMKLAGFSAGQADQLRRAMTRKRSLEAMLRLESQFYAGATANHVPLATAKKVFTKLKGFSAYGFPKGHAAAFAILAYQSSWLKYHYPAEFLCALLNNQPMGFYPPHVLVHDAKRHGVRVLPPDINQSGERCTIEAGAVRIGLGFIKGLRDGAQRLVAERELHGPYTSLADMVRRVHLPLSAAEALVRVGACDAFGLQRREALWQLGLFINPRTFSVPKGGPVRGRQQPLALPVEQDMASLPPVSAWESMQADYATLELTPGKHPFALLREHLPGEWVTTAELAQRPDGARLQIAGLVVCRQRPQTARGITFLLLEDEHGLLNIIVFADLYETQRHVVRREPFIVVEGVLQRRNNVINLIAEQIRPLAGARATFHVPERLDHRDAWDWKLLTWSEDEEDGLSRVRQLEPVSHNFH